MIYESDAYNITAALILELSTISKPFGAKRATNLIGHVSIRGP